MSRTIFINKVVDPEKPWRFIEDTKENILSDLQKYTLDPIFEEYGNFVYVPTFENKAIAEEYKGMTAICGNFATYSHAFNLYTDDADLIKELKTAIIKNQQTEAYQEIKAQLIHIK